MVFFMTVSADEYSSDLSFGFSESAGAGEIDMVKVTVTEAGVDGQMVVQAENLVMFANNTRVVVLTYGDDDHAKDVNVVGVFDDLASAVKEVIKEHLQDSAGTVDWELTADTLDSLFMDRHRVVSA